MPLDDLAGRRFPDILLTANNVSFTGLVNPSMLRGFVVIFCYPQTGRPGHADPLGWDNIPGAHGSTAQALAYAKHYSDFQARGVGVFGLSLQDYRLQLEFAVRNQLSFQLLSDKKREFSNSLRLPHFTTGGTDYLKRVTLIACDGVIVAVRFPVTAPENDAEETLAMLQLR